MTEPSGWENLERRPGEYVTVHLDQLRPVYGRPPFVEYWLRVWQRRQFVLADARGRVVSSTQGFLLGTAWLVLKPIFDAMAYLVIFGFVLKMSRGIDNFLGYLLIGIFLFGFTTRTISAGANALHAGRNLIKGFSFPKAVLPVAVVVRECLNLVPTLVVLVVLVVAIPPHATPGVTWVAFPAVLALQILFTAGVSLLAARATAHMKDLTHVIAVVTRFWFYGSGVFFNFENFGPPAWVMTIIELNPMFQVLDMSRDLLLYATWPSGVSWAILGGWTLVALVWGMVAFWRGEESYGSL